MNNLLKELINPEYLKSETVRNIKSAFLSNQINHIQLLNFLQKDKFQQLQKEMLKLNYSLDYHPDLHSYFTAAAPESFLSLLELKEFQDLMSQFTGTKISNFNCEASYFGNRNYTLLSDKQLIKEGIAFFLDFNSFKKEFGSSTVLVKNKDNLIQYPSPNSILLAKQSKHQRSFIKYVNHLAKDQKRFILKGVLM